MTEAERAYIHYVDEDLSEEDAMEIGILEEADIPKLESQISELEIVIRYDMRREGFLEGYRRGYEAGYKAGRGKEQ